MLTFQYRRNTILISAGTHFFQKWRLSRFGTKLFICTYCNPSVVNNAIFNVCMETYSVGHCNCIAGESRPKAKYSCVEDSKNDDEDSDCMILTRTPPKTADLTVKIVHSDEHFLKQQIKPAFISSNIHIRTTHFCLLSLVALKVCVCCLGCDGGAGLGSGGGLCFLASRHCPV